jgi:hypothetical protein
MRGFFAMLRMTKLRKGDGRDGAGEFAGEDEAESAGCPVNFLARFVGQDGQGVGRKRYFGAIGGDAFA